MFLRRCIWISGLTALLAFRPTAGMAADTAATAAVVPAAPRAAPAASAPTTETTTPAAPPRRPQAVDRSDEDTDDLRALVEEGGERSRIDVSAWVGTGVTVALLGVAAFFAASAAGKEGDVNRLVTYRDQTTGLPLEYGTVASSFEDDVRVGRRDNRLAKGFGLAAAGTALVSTTLFVIDALRGPTPAESKPPTTARPTFSLSGDGPSTPAGVFGVAWRLP